MLLPRFALTMALLRNPRQWLCRVLLLKHEIETTTCANLVRRATRALESGGLLELALEIELNS